MAEQSSAHNDGLATQPDTRIGTPLPKSDTIHSGEAVTRVNSMTEKKTSPEKQDTVIPAVDSRDPTPSTLLTGSKLGLAHLGFLLAILCVALDQTIVATALPKLASEFNALDQLTWVVSAYFLTQAGLMLTFGQILTIAPSKWVYTVCIILFEIGSLICGVAPNMNVLIFGRAFQGVGASGIFLSILTILSLISRLDQRPLLFGSFGGVFALASVCGPVIGGVFVDRATWRWCFYINLPFGAISVAAVLLFVPSIQPVENVIYDGKTAFQKWLSLDWVGAIISVAMIVCLLLPLQWGGALYAWNDRRVIALFCVFGVLFLAFLAWEFFKGKRAMLPLFLFRRRTQVGSGLAMFFMMIAFLAPVYYLPLYLQVKGRTPSQSGIDIIPFMLAVVIASFTSGGIVNAIGHYLSFIVVGPLIAAVGAGLLFTLKENTSSATLIGYQIIFGAGLGLSFQLPIMAVQAEYAYEPELIPQASSLLTFLQLLGGVIGIAIAGTIFNNQLGSELAGSGLSTEIIQGVKQSVVVVFTLPMEVRASVVTAYIKAVDYTFVLAIPALVCTSLAALFIKNHNLKQRSAGPAVAV